MDSFNDEATVASEAEAVEEEAEEEAEEAA